MAVETHRQTISTSETSEGVFVFNDISLVVPPSQITVQKEDLSFQWRTLRSKASTKIPTGNGQVAVHWTAYFPSGELIKLHRMIVQFRHSPFCYIENRYLRETIVPDWSIGQNMAFTLTGLNISPMPGSSDTWVAQVDMTWFNYFPYLHNWLYRKEWQTNFIEEQYGNVDERDLVSYGIGWSTDPDTYERSPAEIIVDRISKNDAQTDELTKAQALSTLLEGKTQPRVTPWSVVESQYLSRDKNTIYEMEESFPGVEFDLQPLPGNMMPSNFVTTPAESNVYVRYINNLQADALLKNFSIDVRKEIPDSPVKTDFTRDRYFAVDFDTHRTFPLHEVNLRRLHSNWLERMLAYNNGIRFTFNSYNEFRLPQEWTDKVMKKNNKIFANALGNVDKALKSPNFRPYTGDATELNTFLDTAMGGGDFNGQSDGIYSQRKSAEIILKEFVANGLPLGIAMAAVVNAYAESRLDPYATAGNAQPWLRPPVKPTDTARKEIIWRKNRTKPFDPKALREESSGLFMLNPIGAKSGGYGLTEQQRWDPYQNVHRIIEIVNGPDGHRLRTAYEQDATVSRLAELFCYDIEKPTKRQEDSEQRGILCGQIWPDYAQVVAKRLAISDTYSAQQAELEKKRQEEAAIQAALTQGSTNVETPSAEMEAISAILIALSEEGWRLYDQDPTVTNVWSKQISINVQHSAADSLGADQFVQEGVILTGVSAGLSHIVAQLPILSHEFPTQQFLGSIEPVYQLQFHVLDDRGDLGGISALATFIQGMRSLLQSNARRFRPIPDGWCVATDTFITRFLGTYEEQDISVQEENGQIADLKTLKRTIITRSVSATVEGNPGLSVIQFDLEETNPYLQESLEANSPSLADKELERRAILQAVWQLKFDPKFEKALLPLLIASGSDFPARTGLSEDPNDYRFALTTYTLPPGLDEQTFFDNMTQQAETGNITGVPIGPDFYPRNFILEDNGVKYVILRDEPGEKTIGETLALANANFTTFEPTRPYGIIEEAFSNANAGTSTFYRIPLSDLDSSYNDTKAQTDAFDFANVPLNALQAVVDGADAVESLDFAKVNQRVFSYMTGQSLNGPEARANLLDQASNALDPYKGRVGYDSKVLSAAMQGRWNSAISGRTWLTLSPLIEEYPQLAGLPVNLALDYHRALLKIVKSANRMFSEEELGGLTEASLQDMLYGLPAQNHQWKAWQAYLVAWVRMSFGYTDAAYDYLTGGDSSNTALVQLANNPNYPFPGARRGERTSTTWSNASEWTMEDLAFINEVATGYYGVGGSPTHAVGAVSQFVTDYVIGMVGGAVSSNITTAYPYNAAHKNAIDALVQRYMRSFPASVNFPETLKSYYNQYLGGVLGNYQGDANVEAAFHTLVDQFGENAYSCGNITAGLTGQPIWEIAEDVQSYGYSEPDGESVSVDRTEERRVITGALGAGLRMSGARAIGALTGLGRFVPDSIGETIADPAYKDNLLAGSRRVGNPLNTPFKFTVNKETEQRKIKFIKEALAGMADEIKNNPELLTLFGLESLAYQGDQTVMRGKAAYPDMVLPYHPYYRDNYSVTPDFYMWNIYEDAGAMKGDILDAMYESVSDVVTNAYNSMKQMQSGYAWDQENDTAVQEVGLEAPIHLTVKIRPEGTDSHVTEEGQAIGATGFPFAPGQDSTAGEKAWLLGNVTNTKLWSTKPVDFLNGIKLSASEGYYGAGGGVQYPFRVGPDTYTELKGKVANMEAMFGSRAGYLGEYIDTDNTPEIFSRIKGTKAQPPSEYTHKFSLESLKQLAKDSSKDIASQRLTLRGAYPTYKLYFIEEDTAESRFLTFDDFHSYNGVKAFSVVSSRKLPADHAVITLQNVGGVLDGTKRNTIVDLDYFDKSAEKKLAAMGLEKDQALTGDAVYTGTQAEQPFGAVVLRPGLNVQLRTGFSNDPNQLQVLISGRVVDVAWNKSGDLAEITVQSFGAELTQQIKGNYRDGTGETYATTHHLLAALMLEPEVVHFGRWSIGQMFQLGEAQDARLDFKDYSKEGFLGSFGFLNSATNFVMNHPVLLYGLAFGVAALDFVPLPLGKTGKFLSQGLRKIGINPKLGKSGWTAIFKKGITTRTNVTTARKIVAQNTTEAFALLQARGARRYASAQVDVAKNKLLDLATTPFGELDDAFFDNLGTIADELESGLLVTAARSRWMVDPSVTLADGVGTFVSKGIGSRGPAQFVRTLVAAPTVALTGAAVGGFSADAIYNTFVGPNKEKLVDSAQKFFSRTRASMFLSPQDDNIYCPHPKDYLRLDKNFLDKTAELVAYTTTRITQLSDEYAEYALGFWRPSMYFSKLADTNAASYTLISTTIWDVFHEMSLRHPGWVYGARPYGLDFRYTMFFGVPSQRYWSKPATNAFVSRINNLRRLLETKSSSDGVKVTDTEFRALYGEDVYETLRTKTEAEIQNRISATTKQQDTYLLNVDESDYGTPTQILHKPVFDQVVSASMQLEMNAIVMKEYLRGLELRFVPFRRYHLLTSERDIIWNGIIGSEQAAINAVDVTYYSSASTQGDDQAAEVKTELFKAHAFLPEHMLKVATIRYPNCKTYQMAMRYGMGELMNRMKDMYRGEIIIRGNPRIRPWDIGIIVDSYNDLVGPIEVEQVVHNFSFETGFTTEIKPSAVVIGNEISSWPMLEAMKMFSMAIIDMEQKYGGVQVRGLNQNDVNLDLGGYESVVHEVSSQMSSTPFSKILAWYHGVNEPLAYNQKDLAKYQSIFGKDGAGVENMFGANPPDFGKIDGAITDAEFFAQGIAYTGVAALGVGGSVALLNAFTSLDGSLLKSGSGLWTLMKNPKVGLSLLAGTSLIAGAGAVAYGSNFLDFPSTAWLVGGPILFAMCMREEAVQVVPLMKNGHPIVAGLNYNDPGLIWKSVRGEINRWVDDSIDGTRDMAKMYERYGTALWNNYQYLEPSNYTGESQFQAPTITGF